MKKERLFYLDFIKAIACWAVFTCHFSANTSNMFKLSNKIFPTYMFRGVYMGTFGVSLFFIASGTGLYYSWNKEKKHSLKNFYKKRFLAIYPMYWIAWVFAAIATTFVYKKFTSASSVYFINTVLGFDGYLRKLGLLSGNFYLVGEWFLGCILLMYLIAPLFLYLVTRHPKLTVALSFGLSLFCLLPGLPKIFIHSKWILRRLPEFVFGMAFAKLCPDRKDWRLALKGTILFLAILATAEVFPDKVTYDTLICMSWFLIFSGIAEYVRPVFPIENVVSAISKYSYAIFLCHHKMISLVMTYFHPERFHKRELVILYLAFILATSVASKFLYNTEKKVRQFTTEFKNRNLILIKEKCSSKQA